MSKIIYKRILVAVDFSEPSEQAMQHAFGLAQASGAQIHVIYVIEDSFRAALPWASEAQAQVERLRAIEFEAANGKLAEFVPSPRDVDVELMVRNGDVEVEVLGYAQEIGADLIVIANVGRRRVGELLLGSSAASLLRTSTLPVLLVPPAA